MNWKHIFLIVLTLTIVVAGVFYFSPNKNAPNAVAMPDTNFRAIQLAGQDVRVTVVATPEARARGLGGRNGLAPDEGMLFIFDTDAKYGFWMKGMRFSIDILWISDKGEVVDAREHVSPATYPQVFTPNAPARYVLELPAGFVKENKVSVGEIVLL